MRDEADDLVGAVDVDGESGDDFANILPRRI
jgi:hypothetical protein